MFNNEEEKWRFPGNNYGSDQGIETPDMETFAKDPIASLARESCQNSIDAKLKGKTARIEFKTFDIKKEDIPGIESIEEEVDLCLDYRKNNKKIYDVLEDIKKQLNNEMIHCLRISDFNTTGLVGITDNDSSPFYLLTKGSGISDKSGSKGGSKGIGKFASFVASSINTVFYSTLNFAGEEGYLGICKLCSTRHKDTDEKTQGIGYYGNDKKNTPILGKLRLDKSFSRITPGTDIYILGFRQKENWKKDLITKILDSFMVAIYYEEFEVIVDDLFINKNTLSEIIDNNDYISKSSYSNLKSQYLLLSDSSVYHDTFDIGGYGSVDIFLKKFNKEESTLATNNCVMVRYPFMKIKTYKNISNVPCSAMCIIGDNNLNSYLREIENPQHTDWEINRVDDTDLRSELKNIINELRDTIINYAKEKLSSSENNETDIEGASEYLPGIDEDDDSMGNTDVIIEQPVITKKLKTKVKDKIGIRPDDDGNALFPDIGDYTDEGEGASIPEGHNHSGGSDIHDTPNETGYKNEDSDNEIMTHKELSGMQYRLLMPDKNSGKIIISFTSLYTENDCELSIHYFDDSKTKYSVEVLDCTINGEKANLDNGKIKNIKLIDGVKYKMELTTNVREYYRFEVKIYANR